MTTTSKKVKSLLSRGQLKRIQNQEWRVSEWHPKITSELRTWLDSAFGRLAQLNVRSMSAKLTKPERLEQEILSLLHYKFRYGIGEWAPFIGKKYFDRKYDPER